MISEMRTVGSSLESRSPVDFWRNLAYTESMSDTNELPLTTTEITALGEIRQRLRARFAAIAHLCYNCTVY